MGSSKPLYSILCAYIPLSVLILWMPIPGTIYNFFIQEDELAILFNEKFFLLSGLFSALGASFYAEAIKKSLFRHKAADIRGGIIVMIAAYLLSSLGRQNIPLAERFLPAACTIAPALASLYAWFAVISMRKIFGGIELFESIKSQYRGEQLWEAVREYSFETGQADLQLKNLIISYGMSLIIPVFLANNLKIAQYPQLRMILILCIFSAGFLLLGFLGILRRELAFASEGIYLNAKDRILPMPPITAGIIVFVILALACSGETSILPLKMLLDFLAWLIKLITGLFRSPNPADMEQLVNRLSFMPMNNPNLPHIEGAEGAFPFFKWIKYGAQGLAVILFLLFLFFPLFKHSAFSLSAKKFIDSLTRWFRELKKSLSIFLHIFSKRHSQLPLANPEKLKEIASAFTKNQHRKDIKKSAALFARLILWGIEILEVPWKPSFAPGEYCASLASQMQEKTGGIASESNNKSEAILHSAMLFEKALYSRQRLSKAEEGEFERLVKSIIEE